ncbi:MAG: hypothetical protein QOI42_1166, partial [Frankiaceae bacterium]|nr:hypothetical protein [Frankiaceae bacterium]
MRRPQRVKGGVAVSRRRSMRSVAVGCAVVLVVGVSIATAGIYPSPAHDFGPVAGANPLYTAANGANPRPLLVILVTFSDLASPAGFTEANTASRVFGPAFPNLASYYTATSFGKMTFTPAPETCGTTNDGVVTVNVGTSVAWLAQADHTENRTVLDAVNALGCVNFAAYDRNSDGKLTDDEVSFLLIDATNRNCGATRSIDPGAVYNGKTIDPGRSMSMSASGTNIITLAHEVGHQALGTRDLYGFGVGSFDLFGPTCGALDSTMFEFNAWQKLHLGWLTPTVVTKDGYYNVPRADTSPTAFILYDPARGTNDYFMVENREPTPGTYDQNATDKGLVIWRADDSQYGSGVDTVRPIDIMRPDGTTNAGCSAGGCYGGSNGDAWDPSDPASPQRTMTRTWRDGTAAKVAVRAIGDAGGTMRAYFDVRGPGVLVDTYDLNKAAPTNVTLGTPGAISFPVMNTGEASDSFNFTAGALPAGWTATTDTQTLGAGAGSIAHIQVTPPITATTGVYTLNAVGTSTSDSSITTTTTFKVNVVRRPTTIVYTGDLTADYHDPAALTATLTDTLTGTPLTGKSVSFTLGTQTAGATTAAGGIASTSVVVDQAPGPVLVSSTFAGDATYLSSFDAKTFTITREETTTTYVGPTVILQGASGVTLTARLLEDGTTPPVPFGQSVTLSLGLQSCVATADASGVASCSLTFTGALGPEPLAASFAGDTYYLPSADTGKTAIVFAFPSRGAFVLGDETVAAAGSSTVTWWGARWAASNSLSGGPAPASFKGFAGTVALPDGSPPSTCGGAWTTRPGNSTPPVGNVPSYMGVVVTGGVTKSSS